MLAKRFYPYEVLGVFAPACSACGGENLYGLATSFTAAKFFDRIYTHGQRSSINARFRYPVFRCNSFTTRQKKTRRWSSIVFHCLLFILHIQQHHRPFTRLLPFRCLSFINTHPYNNCSCSCSGRSFIRPDKICPAGLPFFFLTRFHSRCSSLAR